MTLRLGALVMVTLLLNACASSTGTRESTWPFPPTQGQTGTPSRPDQQPTPIPQPPASPQGPTAIEPVKPPTQSHPRTAESVSGQAVVSLMRQASEARTKGQLDLAASQLERAQRIEPRNYFVWSALAKVYLDQEQYDQAISVAGKSTSLARGNLFVEVENWKTIARAMQAKGDSLGAVQAEARVDEIERALGGG